MLVNMEWRDRNEILSSSSLKTLKITSEDGCLGTFSFDTPNLVYLDYSDCVAEDYPLVNLENLVEVAINLMQTADRFYQARENVWKLIHGIRNVKILHLSPVSFEVSSSTLFSFVILYINLSQFVNIYNNVSCFRCFLVVVKRCRFSRTLHF